MSQDTPAGECSSGTADEETKQSTAKENEDQRKPVPIPDETHFDIMNVCFSFHGRVPRSVYWFALLGSIVSLYFGVIASASVFGEKSSTTSLMLLLVFLLFFWSQLAIAVKRFHDLGMSGFWFPLLLLPGIGQCVQFFLLGLRRGDPDENKYGHDPLTLFK
ncbi:MAG TPA: hypothetical protein DDZ51_14675 [Planctomycetaceae bacterium]|nr:hypothetical protein [Planctomycetaceae bacterium]